MTLIDNGYGAYMNMAPEGSSLTAILMNSFVYGETPAQDCFY